MRKKTQSRSLMKNGTGDRASGWDRSASPSASHRQRLFKNTAWLYVLRVVMVLFSFITFPYLTRVLGAAHYARLGIASALANYFSLFLDFGSTLSATEAVSREAMSSRGLGRIMSAVFRSKLILFSLAFTVLFFVPYILPQYAGDRWIYHLFLISALIESLMPDFMYRGLEDMRPITLRVAGLKLCSTVGIVLLLKQPEQLWIIPVLQIAFGLIALVWCLVDLAHRHGVRFQPVTGSYLRALFRSSAGFFLSRIAGTMYTTLNTLLLGGAVSQVQVSYYASSDRLVVAAQNVMTPVPDALYPYLIRNKDLRIVKKILLILMPPIIAAGIVTFIFAEPICVFILGAGFEGSGPVLRAMLPALVFTLPEYIFGFPVLAALGKTRHANYSVYLACGVDLVLLAVLWANGWLSTVTLAALLSFVTLVDLAYRFGVAVHAYRQQKSRAAEE